MVIHLTTAKVTTLISEKWDQNSNADESNMHSILTDFSKPSLCKPELIFNKIQRLKITKNGC